MKAKWLIPVIALAAGLAGCGEEAPKEGDNPAASNAVSSSDSPNAAKRGAPGGLEKSIPTQTQSMPASRKGG